VWRPGASSRRLASSPGTLANTDYEGPRPRSGAKCVCCRSAAILHIGIASRANRPAGEGIMRQNDVVLTQHLHHRGVSQLLALFCLTPTDR
jgi:hypothetical protein